MHDLDHGRAEAEAEFEQFEQWEAEGGQLEADEFEFEDAELYEAESESLFCKNGEMCEAQETELALELLEVSSEEELEKFLGNLMRKAVSVGVRANKIWNSPNMKKVRDIGTEALKAAAGKAIPLIGKAVGERVGMPTAGERIAGAAGKLLGLELEGLSGEDQEFELARGYVRFAGNAARNMAQFAETQEPRTAIRNAVAAAARVHAPGLLTAGRTRTVGGPSAPLPSASGQSGRWLRRGSKIVLYGV